jgi:TRAP-type C4-dicarboxylate transport system substrate-binding protein
MQETKKIKWLIAHEPVDLFLRTAKAFSKDVYERTNGAIEIEILTSSEFSKKYNRPIENPLSYMEEGLLEMSQLHISHLWKYNTPAFMALELPFLFNDHDHVARVVEGKIGQEMLESLKEKSPARGLAFTYSGGYRVMLSNEEINTLADFKNLKFYTGTNPIAIDTIEAIGGLADPQVNDQWGRIIAEEKQNNHDAVDTTLPRVPNFVKDNSKKRYITDTKHSIFLTTIVVSEKWWNTLTDELKSAISKSAIDAARLERQWSLEDAEELIKNASEQGLFYKELDQKEMEKFHSLTHPLYTKYDTVFMPGFIDQIKNS